MIPSIPMILVQRLGAAACGAFVLTCALSAAPVQQQPRPVSNAGPVLTTQTLAEFQKRVGDYASLHKKLDATLPKLSKDATPQDIDRDQRAIEQLVVQARPGATVGNTFTPDMQAFVRALLADVFKGREGAMAREAVFDEPNTIRAVINKRYPDDVPLSTMPPRLLASLPKLPDELEYRFVNDDLILMDVHAHIIVDYVTNALPVSPKTAAK